MPWLARLAAARTQDEALQVAREYVAQLSASDIDALPKDCRPGEFASADQLRTYAHRLANHPRHGDNARLVHRVAGFFSKAAVRLRELAPPGHPPK